jgi:large subunit ribosomal protein L3
MARPADGLLGTKLGMTQVFGEDGRVIPVTVIQAGPCYVTQIKTVERDGYNAIQLAYGETRKLTRPERGHLRKAGVPPMRYLREFRVNNPTDYQLGQQLTVSIFRPGEKVDVIGTSKGRGFAGVVKRHGFRGGPRTHGQSDRLRAPGSIGAGTTPGHVLKGTRMAGHMGNQRVTIKNLEIVRVDPERNLLLVKGSVPGHIKGLVMVRRVVSEELV